MQTSECSHRVGAVPSCHPILLKVYESPKIEPNSQNLTEFLNFGYLNRKIPKQNPKSLDARCYFYRVLIQKCVCYFIPKYHFTKE